MTHTDIIRAWKDAEYRDGLSEAERARLPEHPAGATGLSDDEMDAVVGGAATNAVNCTVLWTVPGSCCPPPLDFVAPTTPPTRPVAPPKIGIATPPAGPAAQPNIGFGS
jgi:mersacidin/lichenicidin family type 2 lantibiotic